MMTMWLWVHGSFALSPLPLRLPLLFSYPQRLAQCFRSSPQCFLQGFNSRPCEGFAQDSQLSWLCRTPVGLSIIFLGLSGAVSATDRPWCCCLGPLWDLHISRHENPGVNMCAHQLFSVYGTYRNATNIPASPSCRLVSGLKSR
jgi:hypothetical protein